MSSQQLAAWGLSSDDIDSTIEVWECNQAAWEVFMAMVTQWRSGMGGPIGLDYSALPAVFDLVGTPKKSRKDVFADIRTMEFAALDQIAENKDNG